MSLRFIHINQLRVYYRPGTADESVLQESFHNDIFLKNTPEYRIQPHHIVFDIGAHIGSFSLMVAMQLTTGKVYAFEPAAETYTILRKNIDENNLAIIEAAQVAVAAKDGTTQLYHDLETGNWGHSITKPLSYEQEIVSTTSLQTFINNEGLETIDFIKFNCEGAEFDVLLHTPGETLKKIKCMLILYHEQLVDGMSYETLVAYLRQNGFNINHRNRDKPSQTGWIVAWQAGTFENLLIRLRTTPLYARQTVKEVKRKWMRLKSILSKKESK